MKTGGSRVSALNASVSIAPNTSSGTRDSFIPSTFRSLNPFSWIGNAGAPSARLAGGRTNLARGSTAQGANNVTTVTRQALALRSDPAKGGKYVANLSEVQVTSAEDAKRVVRLGQVNRRVFGTVANKESSRSHAVFTVRVERIKRDLEKVISKVSRGQI